MIFHPTERTVLSVTEIYHKPDIYVANTTGLLFTTRPELAGRPLSKMIGFDYSARDGSSTGAQNHAISSASPPSTLG
ncbi:hypothetical protein niasHT_023296 [Heterodera trifolii]|uniref:Uncharacterized protein n=1 Tax=Heterodera trifolii TaxID=157864 RepID=A0ABD2JDH9_9BILA